MKRERQRSRGPVRRCVACRERAPKGELLRFVWTNGSLVCDRSAHMQARGAYLHLRASCVNRIEETRLWERAFRLPSGAVSREVLRNCRSALADDAEWGEGG
jgi:uncharacterized protein